MDDEDKAFLEKQRACKTLNRPTRPYRTSTLLTTNDKQMRRPRRSSQPRPVARVLW